MPHKGISATASATGVSPDVTISDVPTASASVGSKADSSNIELPKNCNYVRLNKTNTIALCQAPQPTIFEKLAVNAPSIVLSLVAVGISIATLIYNRSKDRGARQQSIKDDFWLRKIVSPISIEPLLKYWTELPRSLPTTGSANKADVEQYWVQQQKSLEQFYGSFRVLILIDEKLAKSVEEKLEEFEDGLAIYCGAIQAHLADGTILAPDRAFVLASLTEIIIAVFKLIQDHQSIISRTLKAAN